MQLKLKIMLAIACAALLAFACAEDEDGNVTSQNREVPDEIVTDFTTEETDSGLVRWKLTAPRANKYNTRKVFLMDSPRIEFFDDLGNLRTTLTSENGEFSQTTRDMLAYGKVVVVSVEGDVLETDSLTWLNGQDKIVSDSFVKLTRGNDVITGIGMECDHNMAFVEIKRDIKARIVDEEQREFDG